MSDKNLLIVTQSIDENDPLLGFFIDWITEFSKHYARVHVICLRSGAYNLPPNVLVHSMGGEKSYPRYKKFFLFFRYLLELKCDYGVVFVHMIPTYVLFGAPLWLILRKKIYLWYTHGHVPLSLRLAELFVTAIFTASQESCNLKSEKIRVTGHGINTELFNPRLKKRGKSKVVDFITVGRISPSKRVIEMINFVKRQENSRLTIIGGTTEVNKEYFDIVQKKVQEEQLNQKVKILVNVLHKTIPKHLHRADIFLNFSTTDSLDKAVLEALYCGVPVITTNCAFKKFKTEGLFYLESEQQPIDVPRIKQAKVNTEINQPLGKLVKTLVRKMS